MLTNRNIHRFLVVSVFAGLCLAPPASVASAITAPDLPATLAPVDRLDEPSVDLSFRDGVGKIHHLRDHLGHAVVLHLWATWCQSCRSELPALAKALLQQGHGLAVLAVATDPPGEQAKVAAFLAQLHGQLPPLVAIADANLQPYLTWGVPVTYLIDRDGKVKARLLGPRPWSQTAPLLGPAIESFLAPAAVAPSKQVR